MAHEDFIKGLEGVLAAQSSICFIDGAAGRLTYRGIDIQDLAENSTFEETAYFLLFGHLPKQSELDAFVGQLQNEREVPTEIYTLLRTLPSTATPMEVLRTATSALSAYDPDGHDNSDAANVRKAVRLIAQMTTLTTAYDRIRRGLEPIKPDPSLSMAESFLYGLTGEKPHPSSARVFDVCLILHADHELNASTFAARVIASTLSDVHAAVTGAIGALAGSLHGGANQRVLEMLLEIGELDKVEAYVDNLFANKKKSWASGTASIARWTRGQPSCASLPGSLAKMSATRSGTRWPSASSSWPLRAKSSTRTWISSRRRCSTRSTSRWICSRRFLRAAAFRAGWHTPSSSCVTTVSSGRWRFIPGRKKPNTSRCLTDRVAHG